MRKLSFNNPILMGAAGLGGSMLENATLFKDQPESIQHINDTLGTVTGIMLANPATRAQAIAAWPMKQMVLTGVGGLEKLRREMSDLTETNLATAKTNLGAASVNADNAQGAAGRSMMYLLPALLAGGGLGYLGYDRWKKNHTPKAFGIVDRDKRPQPRKAVKLSIPAGSLPPEFYQALADSQHQDMKVASADDHKSLPGVVGGALAEFSGVPALGRSVKDLGRATGMMDAGDQPKDFGRYALSGLGNLAFGAAAMRTATLPLLGKLLGRARLQAVLQGSKAVGAKPGVGGWLGRQLTHMPTFTRKFLWPNAFGNQMNPAVQSLKDLSPEVTAKLTANYAKQGLPVPKEFTQAALRSALGFDKSRTGVFNNAAPHDRLLNMKGRYDPTRYAWDNPTGPGWFKGLLANRGTPSTGLVSSIYDTGRYGAGRAVDMAYRGKQMLKRNPNLTAQLGATPFIGMGSERDEREEAEANKSLQGYLPDWFNKRGPHGMPVTSTMANFMSTLTGKNSFPGSQEIKGYSNPFAGMHSSL